jgi:hypothetical protein
MDRKPWRRYLRYPIESSVCETTCLSLWLYNVNTIQNRRLVPHETVTPALEEMVVRISKWFILSHVVNPFEPIAQFDIREHS